LKGEESLTIAVPPARKRSRRQRDSGPVDPMFEALRNTRRELATAAAVPPYVIFHDSTLRDIAAARPRSLSELRRIPGIGVAKLERYGEAMIAAVIAHEETSDVAPA
jgi:ATP-dependent DNA helicase RecQ